MTVPVGYREVDITALIEASPRGRTKLPWDERVELIKTTFPSVEKLGWRTAFDRDLELFAWVIADILKADGAVPGRSGPKQSIDLKAGSDRLRQLMGEDYSFEPFEEAFKIMSAGRSLAGVAAKTGLSRSRIDRLLRGVYAPTATEMEMIAKGFGREPGHFAEYRADVVLSAISRKLLSVPESSVKWYRELAKR